MSAESRASAGRPPVAHRPSPPRTEVAAAVLTRADGSFLLGERPAGKPYAGYWEFPGGKIERGEPALAALARELREELGIEIERAYPWLTRDHDYEHAAVRLRFYRVVRWRGEVRGRENQRFSWQPPDAVRVGPLLPANAPVLRALALPPLYGISSATGLGRDQFLLRLERALAAGLRLVQVREKTMERALLCALAQDVVRIARRYGARVLVNDDEALARTAGADGVHLTAASLERAARRPPFELVGASCHDAAELARAAALGADFAVLGPVRPTPSHPASAPLGWERFAALIRDYPLPVYALGGMQPRDLESAWEAGAHGVAMMRAAWG
jgi:8-oxo-dGTP diphosphatase